MGIHDYRSAKQRVVKLVSNEKTAFQPPFHYRGIYDPIAQKLGIEVKESELPFSEGSYVPSSPPQIIIDPRIHDPDRLNFTFFHEITHHLIAQDNDLIEFLNEYAYNEEDRTLERLCNIGATEFLAPLSEIHAIIEAQGFRISLIELLDQRFPASKPALALQLAEAAPHQCVIVICEHGLPPRKGQEHPGFSFAGPQQPYLFVQYAATSPSCKYPCGRFAPIPQNHLIWAAYQDNRSLKGQATIPLPSGRVWTTNCDAHFYLGKVYAAFNITAPPAKEQLSLGFF